MSGIAWPALPAPAGALLLALQYQLAKSERWPAPQLEEMQFEALQRLLVHAVTTVPYYGEHGAYGEISTGAPLTPETWSQFPILTRADVLEAGRTLGSRAAPADHAPLYETVTSGTTGAPVHIIGTRVTSTLWQAITLRDLSWHPRDVTGKLAAIRAEAGDTIPPEGVDLPGWGAATDLVYDTGPCALLSIGQDIQTQADWLVRHDPDYLLSYPSNLLALADHFRSQGLKLGSLRGVTSYGEVLDPEVRAACRDTWGAEVVDMYSAQEVGYIALQCPKGESYHVQSESVYVEVLDDNGRACAPGEVGRVVVSTLHNFAMPLLRYEVGDLAEVGDRCPCGRKLPVLTRLAGRQE
ncbi:MAG TPA: AMP-binding protein [Acidimicrobiales bacterium]|nr:AMP-binding protein [Acidimicrobiales bacterium]